MNRLVLDMKASPTHIILLSVVNIFDIASGKCTYFREISLIGNAKKSQERKKTASGYFYVGSHLASDKMISKATNLIMSWQHLLPRTKPNPAKNNNIVK